jgi:hypothetical protein
MRIIEVVGCTCCPYFKQTDGYNRVYVCTHPKFTGGFTMSHRLKKDGTYPLALRKKVHKNCPLQIKEPRYGIYPKG